VYTATVTLTAAPDWTFEGTGANAFTHTGAVTESSGTGSGVVTVTFPATTSTAAAIVDDLDMTYKIPAPVMGGTPVTYFSSPQYTGWVDWYSGGIAMPHSVFQGGTAYQASVTLAAASGWTLGGAGPFTHLGAESTAAAVDNGNGTITVSVAFPATTSVAAVIVGDLDMTYQVPQPVNGGTPVTYFSTPQYTGNVAWSVISGDPALNGLFKANTVYAAMVTLTAVSGYTFAGVGANGFTYSGGPTAINSADSGVVTITFPATGSVAASMVDNMDLTYHVPVPVWGGTPVMYVSDGQYTGNVVWKVTSGGQTLSGLFESGTGYTATVTLIAASGYTFSGVGANAFNHTGKDTISNAANSRTVTITFPATTSIPVTSIPSVNLTDVLSAPITGASPLMSFDAGTYHETASWRTSRGTLVTLFESGTVYTATVTLTPAPGYSFPTGLPVTHSGINIAAFTGEPRQGTITFPATGILSFYSGPFSGTYSDPLNMDSVIDLIRAAKDAAYPYLYLQLSPWSTETVNLSTADRDITGGLVLNPATNSSPAVVIDGGKRIIQLTGTAGASLITVKTGVTLTLRNITLKNATGFALVTVDTGGQLILEDGAVIIGSALTSPVATGGTVTYAESRTTLGAYDEMHTFSADGTITFSQEWCSATVEVLVVADGGGAGGYIHVPSYPVAPGSSFTVKVGAGGAKPTYWGSSDVSSVGGKGGNSEFGFNTTNGGIKAIGGGGGVTMYHGQHATPGSGGSGGGAAYGDQLGSTGGVVEPGIVPATMTAENLGNAGGPGVINAGGSGVTSDISGTATEYARGGNPGTTNDGSSNSAAGTGNGGNGGGWINSGGGNGGSGTVIVRFPYPGAAGP
jgi:hypothetical protein